MGKPKWWRPNSKPARTSIGAKHKLLKRHTCWGTDEATHRPEPKKVEEMFLEEREDTHHKGREDTHYRGAQGTHEKGCL